MTKEPETYLLPLNGVNWPEALASWAFLLPDRFRLLMVNRFGDVFLVLPDESVHLLNIANARLERLADNLKDFADLMEVDVLREAWLMTAQVDACIAAGMELKPGELYGYKIPPSLGGAIEVDNVEVTPVEDHYHSMAEIQLMLDELPPDGQP